jgi:hypothetical protein
MSPKICVATGPNTADVRSMTRMPASGPDMLRSPLAQAARLDPLRQPTHAANE